MYSESNSYVQLYIPYDYFKAACQAIKVEYANHPEGYRNYMKYWARNGQYNWICNTTEYSGPLNNPNGDDMVLVKNTYLITSFWINFDGSRRPTDGTINPSGYAYGWREIDHYDDN